MDKDWKQFILSIFDGLYRLDIEKIGSTKMFVKNQLQLSDNANIEKSRFTTALTELVQSHSFNPEDFFQNTNEYFILIDLGYEYCNHDNLFLRKAGALLVNCYAYVDDKLYEDGKELKRKILSKISNAVVSFIVDWKVKYQSIGYNLDNIYKENNWLLGVKKIWADDLTNSNSNWNATSLLGLIYLEEWDGFSTAKKDLFFLKAGNAKQNFAQVLNAMMKSGNELLNDFKSFSRDCILLFPWFTDLVKARMKDFDFSEEQIKENKEQATLVDYKDFLRVMKDPLKESNDLQNFKRK